MHRIIRYTTTLILLTEILTITLTPTQKVTAITKGVIPGNYFTYGRSDGKPWIWRTPSDTPVLDIWKKFGNMSTINFTITQNLVPDPNTISFNQTNKFENQSIREFQGVVDLNTGGGAGMTFFISAGLRKDDRIYPGTENYTWTINYTRTDPYWGGREVCVYNHTGVSAVQSGVTEVSKTIIFWDQFTGVLLAVEDSKAAGTSIHNIIESGVSYELITNNIGIPVQHSGSTDITPIIIVVIVILVVAFIVLIVRISTSAPKKKWKRLEEKERRTTKLRKISWRDIIKKGVLKLGVSFLPVDSDY